MVYGNYATKSNQNCGYHRTGVGKKEVIEELMTNGARIFRFNLKHNTSLWHQQAIKKVRLVANKLGISVAVMVDLPRRDYNLSDINDFDIIALSYVKKAEEIERLKRMYLSVVVAKIENKMALKNLDTIIKAADGIMVARGDLGEAVSFKELAYYQKMIVDKCRSKLKPVIVATEMLLSMVTSKMPTRTEATDVANAVYDGTDAVMLSQETAIGDDPGLCVKTMAEIVKFADKTAVINNINPEFEVVNDALFSAAAEITKSSQGKVKGVVVTTKSGRSGFKVAAFRLKVPVIAISDNDQVLNGLNLGYGIMPVSNKDYKLDKLFKRGDDIILIHGENWLEEGSTNTISIVRV